MAVQRVTDLPVPPISEHTALRLAIQALENQAQALVAEANACVMFAGPFTKERDEWLRLKAATDLLKYRLELASRKSETMQKRESRQHKKLMKLATAVQKRLEPVCERLLLVGSMRRGKRNPKDIEFLLIPKVEQEFALQMFGPPVPAKTHNYLEKEIARMVAEGDQWVFDEETKRNGPKYKRLRHVEATVGERPVVMELFITTPPQWGINCAIRTGPDYISAYLARLALHLGYHITDVALHLHPRRFVEPSGLDPEAKGTYVACDDPACAFVFPTPEEKDLFIKLGLEYVEPELRNEAYLEACRQATGCQ